MSLKSLIAHSGHSHQQSNPSKNSQPIEQETQPNNKSDRPESTSTPKPQLLEAPTTKPETITIQEPKISSELETATLVPGFGESIFVLLIASPFLLLGLKKRLHK